MPLLQIPNELLVSIARELCCRNDITAFLQANKHLYNLLKNIFQIYDIPERHDSLLSCAAISGNPAPVSNILKDMLQVNINARPVPQRLNDRFHRPTPLTEEEKEIYGEHYYQSTLYRMGYEKEDILVIQNAFTDAVAHGRMEVVQLFIARCVNVNYQHGKRNALYAAVANDHQDLVDVLLARGAFCNSQRCALQLACEKHQYRMVRSLLGRALCLELSDVLRSAVTRGDRSTVFFLEENGLDIQKHGYCALQEAIEKGDVNMVKWLENKGATDQP
ncbi:ankyrin [Aspergillus steynii IBT 23096]|uniref:Ankyrin n=1 Tax=Aspergillus steynii IBT 23096 TaxID=1392250 RepID=A0A2I2FVX8_9EURO|nr:ankyrin [Aspergillus steynii IBT 23096]PLB44792.1 ankyrin [Aspergillus steynii IBT 23096]